MVQREMEKTTEYGKGRKNPGKKKHSATIRLICQPKLQREGGVLNIKKFFWKEREPGPTIVTDQTTSPGVTQESWRLRREKTAKRDRTKPRHKLKTLPTPEIPESHWPDQKREKKTLQT